MVQAASEQIELEEQTGTCQNAQQVRAAELRWGEAACSQHVLESQTEAPAPVVDMVEPDRHHNVNMKGCNQTEGRSMGTGAGRSFVAGRLLADVAAEAPGLEVQ